MVFFRTGEHPCSYLDDQLAQTVFLDPEFNLDPQTLEVLNRNGFRRSGGHVYRPDCNLCNQCESSRVLVNEFNWSKSFKRIVKKNNDVSISICPPEFRDEHYELFERYINDRHQDGDMYPTCKAHYQDFLLKGYSESFIVEYRIGDRLIGCTAIDELVSGLSAIYTWFDPEYSDRSIGSYAILQLIKIAERLQIPHVYLGYWIGSSPKMSYKSRFLPLETFKNGNWQQIIN